MDASLGRSTKEANASQNLFECEARGARSEHPDGDDDRELSETTSSRAKEA